MASAERLSKRPSDEAPDPPEPTGQRWSVADLLARVEAELARRSA